MRAPRLEGLCGIFRVFRSHSDVQWWASRGAFINIDERANDTGDNAFANALLLLRGWRAGEPEMSVVLGSCRMLLKNVDQKHHTPRLPGQDDDAELFCCTWRSPADGDLSLLQWLRMHTVYGTTAHDVPPRGVNRVHKKTLCCVGEPYVSWTPDNFFWQWLLVNRSHRLVSELCPTIATRVARRYWWFANALCAAPATWHTASWVHHFFAEESHKEAYVQQCAARVCAMQHMVTDQIHGEAPRSPTVVTYPASSALLTLPQQEFVNLLVDDFARLTQFRELTESGEVDSSGIALVDPRFLTCGPGSGKTHCLLAAVKHFPAEGARVLYANPAGKLATTCPVIAGMVSTTIHRFRRLHRHIRGLALRGADPPRRVIGQPQFETGQGIGPAKKLVLIEVTVEDKEVSGSEIIGPGLGSAPPQAVPRAPLAGTQKLQKQNRARMPFVQARPQLSQAPPFNYHSNCHRPPNCQSAPLEVVTSLPSILTGPPLTKRVRLCASLVSRNSQI